LRLERTGYTGPLLGELAKRPMPFIFYLDYAMRKKAFSSKWNLYFPKELDNNIHEADI
jgi:hypothetical protein